MASQKDIFLSGEGDAWYLRNREATARPEYASNDAIFAAVEEIAGGAEGGRQLSLLEIGASNGGRLARLERQLKVKAIGVEPSSAAAADAISKGIDVRVGTADRLDFPDRSFDIVVFGFCLYLCDTADLFSIAAQADRVLKADGWVVIQDFYSKAPSERPYHHKTGIKSRKMDYRTLFDWHPSYTCYSHKVGRHQTGAFEDDPDEWVATSVLRKREP